MLKLGVSLQLPAARIRPIWRDGRAAQSGLSLVELMVGIAIGLVIVAAATLLVSMQLSDNRRLLLEAQLQQDLRASADLIARAMRRSGSLRLLEGHLLLAPGGSVVQAPLSTQRANALALVDESGGVSDIRVHFRSEGTNATWGPYGFLLSGGTILTRLGPNTQALTDRAVMEVLSLSFTPLEAVPADRRVRLPCQNACSGVPPSGAGPDWCWPELEVRAFVIEIIGKSEIDPAVVRRVTQTVHLRNHDLRFNQPGPGAPGASWQACP